jgi:hypothetical protein
MHTDVKFPAARSPRRRTQLGLGAAIAAGLTILLGGPTDPARAQAPAAAPAPAPAPAAAAGAAPTNVGANLNISPKRITFDRADRTATVYVFNQGTAAATFDIALIDRIMTPDGQILAVSEAQTHPEDKATLDRLKSAQGMLVATPRRATLEPGKGQTIRIRAVPPTSGAGNPATGEYRTHLTVTTIPPRDIGLTAEQAAALSPQELRFQINSVFGLSIPVILRVGAPDVRGGIENIKLVTQNISPDGVAPPKPTPVVSFDLVRLGPNSLFGNLEVRGSKDKATADPMAAARGIGVYPEIDRRQVLLPLRRAPQPGEQLEISFKDDDTAPGRLVAKATYNTP